MNLTKQEFIERIKFHAKKNVHREWLDEYFNPTKKRKTIKLPVMPDFDPTEIIIIKENEEEQPETTI